MSRDLRILHLADTHIGAGLPSRPRVERARRGDDLIRSYNKALGRAGEYEVDLVIHAGDVFDRPEPPGPAIAAATVPLLDLASEGIPIVVIPGNHERSVLPESLLLHHPLIHVIDSPQTLHFRLRGHDVSVTGLPCVRRGVAEAFEDQLAASQWDRRGSELRLLVLHQTLESATCGPIGYRFRSGPDVVERTQIPAAFDYVALGHIHRHQQLENPLTCAAPLVYAGSTDRVSFAERDEPKGCVLIELVGQRLRPTFLPHDVRPMQVVPLDVTDLGRDEIIGTVLEAIEPLPSEAHVAIRLSGRNHPRELARLRLSERIAARRPDLLVRIAMQHVEIREGRAAQSSQENLLEQFPPTRPPWQCSVEDLKSLPNTCGTYLLQDARRTVIYIGKSKQVRTRIRGHLRTNRGGNFYSGWAEQVAHVTVRPASSELEALLAEAILVARSRPAFNRQMRLWSRYCYLTPDPERFGQLRVCRDQPPDGLGCFGPIRSRWSAEALGEGLAACLGLAVCPPEAQRPLPLLGPQTNGMLCERYYASQCSGPCGGRISERAYQSRLRLRDALLTGAPEAEPLVVEAVGEAESLDEAADDPVARAIRSRAELFSSAYEMGRQWSRCERLRDGLLLLPADEPGGVTVILLTTPRPQIRLLRRQTADLSRLVAELPASASGRLEKQDLDLFVTIDRALQAGQEAALAFSGDEVRSLGAEGLLAALKGHPSEAFRDLPLTV